MKKLLLLIAFMGIASGIFAQVSKTVNVSTAGTLSSTLASNELAILTNLTLTGTIDARDFKTMRDKMPLLAVLDLSGVTIVAYNGTEGTLPNSIDYPVNAFPNYAFINPKSREGKTRLTTITIPSSVTSIGYSAFYSCSGLITVTIPSSVTSIKESAFVDCSGLITVDPNNPNYSGVDGVLYDKAQTTLIQCPISKIGSLTIPSSVTSIGDEAFIYCSGLTTVTIPSSVTSIGNSAFERCSGLITVAIPSSVTSIGDYAFSLCRGLTTVTIPSSVTSIGDEAFSYCRGLTTIEIPSSVTLIGKAAFYDCSGLTTVTIPSSVTSIGDSAFSGCSELTSVTIPSSVTSIANYAFYGCSGLTSVTIPSSVTSIGKGAFYGCSRLTTVMIPSSVTSIGDVAFWDCTGLTSITIPSSVTLIGDYTFVNCSGLTTVMIPSSMTSIGAYAFEGCTGLTSITTTRLTPLNFYESLAVFYQVNKTTCTLSVPLGSKSAYQVADQWKDFTNIVEKDLTGIAPISDQKLTFYPNPTSGKVKIVFDQIPQGGATLTVNDFTGKTILIQFIHNKEEWIDLKGNSLGVYLIRTNMKDFKVQKVILK